MMINQEIERFYQIVSSNQDLQAKLEATSDIEQFANLAVQLAQTHGCQFTAHEVKIAIAYKQSQVYELSDEQLVAVAGGKDEGGSVAAADDDILDPETLKTVFHTQTEPFPGENSSWCQPDSSMASCGVQNEPGGNSSSGGLSWG